MQPVKLSLLLLLPALGASLKAQTIQLGLTYNFNGIVHAGENFLPDDPNGYRSISDRGLDFTGGVPTDPLLAPYALVALPGAFDIVHLGNRNTVDNGNYAFDLVADNDNVGIQPLWLTNADQTTPQVSVLPFPLPITSTTVASFLYQISNGGGAFDVTFTFAGSGSYTATLSASDWFGGTFAGTDRVDNAFVGNNLSITEGRIDLSSQAGQVVTQISFSNRSNLNAGYAILAGNFEYPPVPRRVNQIPLNYNFNGIVNTGESGLPDDPNGYRSISDRGLDFSAGVPNIALLAPYNVISTPGALDIVHLGDRNTVDGGNRPWDLTADADDIGTQPLWLPNSDHTGPQVTTLAQPILLDLTSRASVLFQVSNGGGAFDVEFGFQTGAPFTTSVSGGDWFGGALPGTDRTDFAGTPASNLSLTERVIDLSAQTGRTLTSITFGNRSNFNAGYAIVATNVSGCLSCVNGTAGSVVNLGGGNGPGMTTSTNGNLGCDLDWTVLGATPNAALGFIALGLGSTSIPLSGIIPPCLGTVHVPNPTAIYVQVNAIGSATATIAAPTSQGLCGVLITGQYLELVSGACPVLMSDAIAITIGN
ncbi:MAG: hypothetical protein KA020_01520 [Planctomycetes bacterium]|jgi:hypothetical protein|nr:hypothetical protein [Planctomycetota bacterium]MCC7064633.1 hypothetical protein [Planctomycetota bacterium]